MKEVNIYTQTSFRGLKRQDGAIGYVLSTMTAKGEATINETAKIRNATANFAEITVLTDALSRLNQPCKITIWTNSFYVRSGIELYMGKWFENGWVNAKGEEIAYRMDWELLREQLMEHEYTIRVGEPHQYSKWLKYEVERKKNERSTGDK